MLSIGSLSASERASIKARITTTDAAKRMPPGVPLPPSEQKLILDAIAAPAAVAPMATAQ